MTASVHDIQGAVITQLNQIAGLRCFDYLPDNFTPPTAIVGISSVRYHEAFGGGFGAAPEVPHDVEVMIIVGRASERAGQSALDDFMSYSGDSSIREAIESDPTLGGVVQSSIVVESGNLKVVSVNGTPYISVDFTMTVNA